MASLTLKILVTLYIFYALLKLFDFFFLKYETRIARIRAAYREEGRVLRIFDDSILLIMLGFVALLFVSGFDYLSFVTGLLVGMTIIQVYFHRFSAVLPSDKSPDPPVSAIKLMSYAIQADPGRAWRELTLTTVLLVWGLYMLATRGFGWFSSIG
jgi:hypothetical protein